jgi:excisionase family DNA binding protein
MARPRPHPNPDALTVDETAIYLRISRAKLAELIARGAVPSYRLGRRRFFLRSVLDQWLHDLATGGSDSAA